MMVDDLRESVVQMALSTRWLGRAYRYFDRIDSTNDRLKAAVEPGDECSPAAGTVFLADYQSQGRGRLNRRWLSPPGASLLLSVLVRPGWPVERAQWLTMAAGLAATEAMETVLQTPVGIKWPNDLVLRLNETWCKVGGLLLEGDVDGNGRLRSAVLGMGLNVNIPSAQLPPAVTPATSLSVAAGRPISRLSLLTHFLQRLENRYERADAGESPQPTWNRRLVTLGRRVQATHTGAAAQLVGTAVGTDEWGRLQVRDDVGALHLLAAGDVTLR